MNTKAALWTGRVLSGFAILFLTVDGAIKLVPIQAVTDSLRPDRVRCSSQAL